MSKSTFFRKIRSLIIVSSGATLAFGGYSIITGNEKFYREVLMPSVTWIPPETTHKLAVLACKFNMFPASKFDNEDLLGTSFFGCKIRNPIGIAAGFDKHGEAIEGLERIGFGFVEIGSVTPLPQPGNPQPRVFRLPADFAVINRYGFNSDGHEKVFQRIDKLKKKENYDGVIGVNLGKNKESENATEDYVKGVERFGPIADYLVINVSSPNTPGLRDLQSKKDLENLLKSVLKARDNLPINNRVPILLKLSPDLTKQDIKDISSVVTSKNCRVDGLIISNTTIERPLTLQTTEVLQESGGLSGAPLREKSTELIANMYYMTSGKIPIIGVGGVFSGRDAYEKITAGASYIQLYTAMMYEGPLIVDKVKTELSNILQENGHKNVSEAVGICNKKLRKI